MIVNLWKNTTFYCLNHETPIEMTLRSGPKTIFYACPKYDPASRNDHERVCMNHMYTETAQKAIDFFSAMIEEYMAQGLTPVMEHVSCQFGTVEFLVLEEKNGKYKVGVRNRAACQ
jgi:hypothetical protein